MSDIWLDAESWFYKPGIGNLWQERFKGKRFDSYLGKSSHPTQNHALKLFVRIHLNPVKKSPVALDSNKHAFPIKDWTPKGWAKFVEQFEKQSRLWNNRFWLIPPTPYSLMDVAGHGHHIRPNVACMLFVELVDSPGLAHRTIDVVNIDTDEVKRRDDIDDDNPRLGRFRSNAGLLNSTVVRTGSRVYEDINNDEYTIKHHYTIAHEIGHALGLKHIGNLKHTAKCEMAMKFKNDKVDPKDVPFQYRDGLNAKVCYGIYDTAGIADNIMGLGYKFEAVNALPWTKRIAKHTNTHSSDWRISLAAIRPQSVR